MNCLSFDGYQSYFNVRSKKDEKIKTIESVRLQKDASLSSKENLGRLIFLMQGRVLVNNVDEGARELQEREFVYVPADKEVCFYTQETIDLIVFRIGSRISLRQYFDLSEQQMKCPDRGFHTLRCTDLLFGYLSQLKKYMDEDISSHYYHNLKLDELLLSCKWFYTKDELARLFSSQLSEDCDFSNYIVNNGYKYSKISELAKDMNYSVSGFDKKFKRIFGVSGYKWLKMQKAKRVLKSIYTENLSFKEIADNFDFSSESYFYEFCKAEFGKTPGQIRKNHNLELKLSLD